MSVTSFTASLHIPPVAVLLCAALSTLCFVPVTASAQTVTQPPAPSAPPGSPTSPAPSQPSAQSATKTGIQGEVTTQSGTIVLGGVEVTLSSGTTQVAQLFSEGDGKFRFDNLAAGEYVLRALFEGFEPQTSSVSVRQGETAAVKLDLRLGSEVRVKPADTVLAPGGSLSSSSSVSTEELEQIAPGGGGLQSALRLLISVIEVPGGIAIKGGRPSQASVQLGAGLFVDPATGLTQASLPDDAIDSVTVLPNPYAVEFGRFSSGLVVIQTRRAADKWKLRLSNLDPSFRTKRGEPLNIQGFATFGPRMELGGPIVKDRVFVHHSFQYRYRANDVPGRPQDELRTSHRLSSFTRLDAAITPKHSIVAVGGIFPSRVEDSTLGTFVPPDATVDLDSNMQTAAVTERTIWSDTRLSETTFEMNRFHVDVSPQGLAPMEALPENTLGNFFNRQKRTATSYQFIHTLSGTSQGALGLHIYKLGFDLVQNQFDGRSASRPILIRRSNGVLTRRLDFGPASAQSIGSTDVALFAQDRVQPNNRWYLETGVRVDRDGVIDRFNVTPRVGAAFLLNPAGTAVVRGGYGLFFERTPSTAGVFQQFENQTETRYAIDGVTPLGPPQQFVHAVASPLRTPRSSTWDLAYDHRFNTKWEVHAGVIDRRGSHELIVDRVTETLTPSLQLTSTGRSRYREAELGLHFTAGSGLDLRASYVRARARADLNAFTAFYDSVLAPVLGDNAFGPARADVPHRFLARWRTMPRPNLLFVGVIDWRSGLPYSVVDQALDFVGRRNSERFPTYFRLDLGIERRIKLFSARPWLGVRVDNVLDSELPAEVQANISSPMFRSFYQSEHRQFRIQFRFER